MKKNYLFILNQQDNYDLSGFDFTDIHIWNIKSVIKKKNHQKIYFYAKDLNEFNFVLNEKHIPHITFLGDSLFSSFYEKTLIPAYNHLERFWFPEKKHLNQDYIYQFLNLPEIHNTNIAIVFNPYTQPDVNYEEFYSFVKLLYSQYKSPLYYKDFSLYEKEFFSPDNAAIINGQKHYVVLGLFGDYYLPQLPNTQILNYGILKDSQCVICDFAHLCQQRGLGSIKHYEKIKSCVGIKLYNHD